MLNEECLKQGIQLGKRIAIDSTPLEALSTDKKAEFNGHYKMNMWKIHEITCLDTHISLSNLVTPANFYDEKFLEPMLHRLRNLGITVEEVYGDHHYNRLENWAKVNVMYGIKCHFKIAKNNKIRKDGTLEEINRQYQRF